VKQAPAWNAIVKEFATDSDVSFGDVVLREDRIIQGPDGGELKPGRGGWPVRAPALTAPAPAAACRTLLGARVKRVGVHLTRDPMCLLPQQTVRYFNQATGYDGAAYEKKTTKAMCDELGDVDTMRQAVETAKAALAAQKAEL
jgi:hypothetical protein